jgi:hypothetical protein
MVHRTPHHDHVDRASGGLRGGNPERHGDEEGHERKEARHGRGW